MAVAAPESAFTDGGFMVEVERFQGPLDLLLHLIREQDIDIFDIPIAQITAQFLAAVEAVTTLGLDRAGEFLEMAALLVRIKAQMVLPRQVDEHGVLEDPRAALVRRLLEYEHFREASLRLEALERSRRQQFGRGYVPPRQQIQVAVELRTTWHEVYAAALDVGTRAQQPQPHRIAARAVPVEEKIGLIAKALQSLKRIEFARLVAPFGDKLHGVVTLLAGLELARQRRITLRQRAPFTPLWLYRRQEAAPDAGDGDR